MVGSLTAIAGGSASATKGKSRAGDNDRWDLRRLAGFLPATLEGRLAHSDTALAISYQIYYEQQHTYLACHDQQVCPVACWTLAEGWTKEWQLQTMHAQKK